LNPCLLRVLDLLRERSVNLPDRCRIEKRIGIFAATSCFSEQRFESRVNCDHRQQSVLRVFRGDMTGHCGAYLFGEEVDVFRLSRTVGEVLQD
jgi:hypothetical protein